MRLDLRIAAMIISGLASCLAGCTMHVAPPGNLSDPVPIYIADYGKHAGLLLPAGDTQLVEYSWGDWNYYALEHKGIGDGLRALFCSGGSTLGRRYIANSTDLDLLRLRLRCTKVTPLQVERSAARQLVDQLNARYQRHIDTEIYNPAFQTYFVRDDKHYQIFHNSTHETADWLRQLGCKVRGYSLMSAFVVKSPPASPTPPSATPPAPATRPSPG